MPVLAILIGLVFLALVFGPSLWAKRTLARHNQPRPDFPGTGGELARHLLDEAGLQAVEVETTKEGDHYDPMARKVRLSDANYGGRTLTAVTVAAHEVGHALQHAAGYGPLETRTRLIGKARIIQRIGSGIIFAAPVLGIFTKSPLISILCVGAGILTLALEIIIHIVTLPVEFDASFKRALPVLEAGRYLQPEDMPAARSILRACAMT